MLWPRFQKRQLSEFIKGFVLYGDAPASKRWRFVSFLQADDFPHDVCPRSFHHLRVACRKICTPNLEIEARLLVGLVPGVEDALSFAPIFCPKGFLQLGFTIVAPEKRAAAKH